MSAARDSVPEAARPAFDEAWDGLGAQFAAARRKRDELYQREGALGVARAAWVPGGPSVEELAEGWERLVQQERERRRTAA